MRFVGVCFNHKLKFQIQLPNHLQVLMLETEVGVQHGGVPRNGIREQVAELSVGGMELSKNHVMASQLRLRLCLLNYLANFVPHSAIDRQNFKYL